jgi:L-aspartate oxidase
MTDTPGAELAPRDVVARAVWRHMAAEHRVFLDARNLRGIDFTRRFPAITSFCRNAGIDPLTQPIPVRPAAHYHMGGISVDKHGRTSVEGLWACGEAACTGLHGANRLASNSLLEAVVCAGLVAQDIAATAPAKRRPPRMTDAGAGCDPTLIRPILSHAAGVLRDGDKLRAAARALFPLAASQQAAGDPAIVALMIVISALRREETRGAHARTDCPERAIRATRTTLRLCDAFDAAQDCVPDLVS